MTKPASRRKLSQNRRQRTRGTVLIHWYCSICRQWHRKRISDRSAMIRCWPRRFHGLTMKPGDTIRYENPMVFGWEHPRTDQEMGFEPR